MPHLIATKGNVVNVSSVNGLRAVSISSCFTGYSCMNSIGQLFANVYFIGLSCRFTFTHSKVSAEVDQYDIVLVLKSQFKIGYILSHLQAFACNGVSIMG